MAVGFRKSLFGFNSSDVINYIEKSHKEFTEKQSALNEQLNAVSKQLDTAKENYEKLLAEKEEADKKLGDFTAKYDEIERLSENIGKLYLVAQANAQAIISDAEKNAKLTSREVEKNLSAIDEAHNSLDELRKNIARTSEDFIGEVNGLINSLGETREQIADNSDSISEHKNQFDEIYRSLTK